MLRRQKKMHNFCLLLFLLVTLPKPRLSLQPSREPSWGQFVQISCSISTQYLGGMFTLQQLFGSFKQTEIATGTSATFTIPRVDFHHSGFYYCLYLTTVSHRDFYSSMSDITSLSVVGE